MKHVLQVAGLGQDTVLHWDREEAIKYRIGDRSVELYFGDVASVECFATVTLGMLAF